MSDNNNGNQTLDLDALYGRKPALKVKWGEREYELNRPDAMGPREVVGLDDLRQRAARLQGVGENMTPAQAEDLETISRRILLMLNADFAENMPHFVARSKIITWYFEQIQPSEDEKKMTAPSA